MKILHVIESLDVGGAERVLLNIIKFNKNKHVEHRILCLANEGPLGDEFKSYGINIIALNKKKGFDPRLFYKAYREIKKWTPDVLHTHLFTGNLWGRFFSILFDIPSVMSVQNEDRWIRGWRKWAECLLVSVPRVTIGASHEPLNYRKTFGLKDSQTIIINNGTSVVPCAGARNKLRKDWGLKETDRVIGVLARCEPQKNPSLFVELAEKLLLTNNQLYFVWAGGGSEYETFKSSMDLKEGSFIRFIGQQTNTMEILAAYDILISTSEREGFSLSLIEGMISSLPILATAVSGNVEMFEKIDTSLLSDGDQARWFVDKLQRWLDNPDEAKVVGKDLNKIAKEKFSAEKMSEGYHDVYKELKIK